MYDLFFNRNIPDKIDNTMRAMFRTCPRKYMFFRAGVRTKIRPMYFTWGEVWHEFLREWYTLEDELAPQNRGICTEQYYAAIEVALERTKILWHKHDIIQDDKNNLVTLEETARRYCAEYPSEPWHVIKGAVEGGFVWPLKKYPGFIQDYYYGGALDLYIDWPQYGQLVLENKSVGEWITQGVIERWDYSNQVWGYSWFLHQLTGEAFGVLVNIASKLTAKAGKTPKFSRVVVTKTPYALEEFEQGLVSDILYLQHLYETKVFPRSSDAMECTGGMGRASCQYKRICRTSIPLERIDISQFPDYIITDEPWAPWERQRELEKKEEGEKS